MGSQSRQTGAAGQAPARPGSGQGWYAVWVLALVGMFAGVDRGVINLLVEPIKRDLHLNDTQFSLLSSLAFVAIYIVFGLPISRLIDSRNRRAMIAWAVALWSVATALCGVAQNFWSLFLCRVAVGGGELVNQPAAYSIIADQFPREKLPRAIAAYNTGQIGQTSVSLILGAVVITALAGVADLRVPVIGVIRNWQLVFFLVGLPGLLIALLVTTIREPARRNRGAGGQGAASLTEVWRFVLAKRGAYGFLTLALALASVEAAAVGTWGPAFLMRTYGWSPARVGMTSGLAAIAAAPIGLYLGARIAEHLYRRGRDDAAIWVVVIAFTILIPAHVLAALAPNGWTAIALESGLATMMGSMAGPAQLTCLQTITPGEMRGQVTTIFLFMYTVVGAIIGPTAVALATDYVFKDPHQLRWAIMAAAGVACPLALAAALLAVKPYGRAAAEARTWETTGG